MKHVVPPTQNNSTHYRPGSIPSAFFTGSFWVVTKLHALCHRQARLRKRMASKFATLLHDAGV